VAESWLAEAESWVEPLATRSLSPRMPAITWRRWASMSRMEARMLPAASLATSTGTTRSPWLMRPTTPTA